MRRLLGALVVVFAAVGVWSASAFAAAPATPFSQCPAVGADTSCAILIVINPGGSLSVFKDATQGPFDGVEDTLVGVLNNSGAPSSSIHLQTTATPGKEPAFGFDQDGLCTFVTCTPARPTGYEGPNNTFANISSDLLSGDVVFTTPLANGASTYFSLEGDLAAVDFTVSGYIEVCKTAGAGITNGASFGFSVPGAVDPANRSISVRAGLCSAPILVAGTPGAGGTFDATVTEATAPWYEISGISVTTNSNGATTTVPVTTTSFPVTPSATPAGETRVTFTDVLVTGFVEVCKSAAPNSGLTSGQFTFHLLGGLNTIDNTYALDTTATVGLGQCSAPMIAPAGPLSVTETGTGVFITDVVAVQAGATTHPAVTNNGVTLDITRSATAGVETRVTFFDALSNLKICKVAGTNALGTFTGNATFTVTGAAGATGAITVAPGTCVQVPGSIIPGSTIGVTEAALVGSQVSAITLNGTDLGSSANLAAGSASFSAASGANVVTFTDVLAPAVLMKVCKAGAPAGSTWAFTIGATAGTITIPSDGSTACTQPALYPYNSSVAITEAPAAGFAVTNIAVAGNARFATGSPNLAGGTATVILGTYGRGTDFVAVVTFTNGVAVTPPPVITPPAAVTPKVTGSNNTTSSPASGTAATTSTAGATSNGSTSSLTGTPSVVKTAAKVSLVTAKLVVIKQGALHGRWLGVQLKGSTATAKVKILLVGKNGHTIGTVIRTIKTGKFVRVMKVGANVMSVRVSPFNL